MIQVMNEVMAMLHKISALKYGQSQRLNCGSFESYSIVAEETIFVADVADDQRERNESRKIVVLLRWLDFRLIKPNFAKLLFNSVDMCHNVSRGSITSHWEGDEDLSHKR